MKKITKICKIFLVLATVFSQLSNTITVFASELDNTLKPLSLELKQIFDEDNGYVDSYELSYQSENKDYEETDMVGGEEVDKTYDITLTSTFTYLNQETTLEKVEVIEDIKGEVLNNSVSTYSLDPISKYYNGTFNLNVTVLDGEKVVYDEELSYIVDNTYTGLIGSLDMGDILPISEEIGKISNGSYEVTEDRDYVQHLILMPGELSPTGSYKIVMSDETRSEVKTGEELFDMVFEGVTISLDGKLAGDYVYNNVITIEEVSGDDVIGTFTYEYNTNIKYITDSDSIMSNIYENLLFDGEYVIVNAKNLYGTVDVITIGEILEGLTNTEMTLEVLDEEGTLLDLEDEMVLSREIKNDYQLIFNTGISKTYTVVVMGDNTSDNIFDSEDMLPTMEKYLDGENILSMDINTLDEKEFGTVTFEDIMYINELLKEDGNIDKDEEDNNNLSLVLGDISNDIHVGDSFEVTVSLNSDDINDYIDGIDALISTNSNLKLVCVEFNDGMIGTYNNNGKLVAAGTSLNSEDIIMTLTFNAVEVGTGTIGLIGKTSKYLNIDEFDEITKEIKIISNMSSNNNLDSLKPSVGKFDTEFSSNTTVYTLYVPYNTESVILSGALADINSKVDGLIEYTLSEDKTTAIITVTAEDGTVKTYTVYIIKENEIISDDTKLNVTPITYYYSSNNYLKLLEIDGYEIEFDKETNEYKINVKSDVSSLDIKAVAEDSNARVEINGNEKFKKGENTVVITVTAEDGTTREYKIVVNKKEAKKEAPVEIEDSSNTLEKVVIIILIILVVLGLLYLIFKKDDTEDIDMKNNSNNNSKNNNSKDKK